MTPERPLMMEEPITEQIERDWDGRVLRAIFIGLRGWKVTVTTQLDDSAPLIQARLDYARFSLRKRMREAAA